MSSRRLVVVGGRRDVHVKITNDMAEDLIQSARKLLFFSKLLRAKFQREFFPLDNNRSIHS
jgi:hypothetical protein